MSPTEKLIWLYRKGGSGGGGVEKTVKSALVHITDALAKPAKKLVAEINPVQDLHGQDAPYPAGGGVNKLDLDNAVIYGSNYMYGLTGSKNTTTQTVTVSGTPTWGGSGGHQFRLLSETGLYTADRHAKLFIVSKSANITEAYVTELTSSDYISINVATSDTAEINLVIQIVVYEGSTAPTSWSPYSNICPITGFTGCNVYDDPKYGGTITWNQLFDTTGTSAQDGITAEYDSENNAIKITNNSRTSNYSTGSTRTDLVDSSELVYLHKYYCTFYPETTGVVAIYGNLVNEYINDKITTLVSNVAIKLRVTKDYDFVTDHPIGDVTEVQFNCFDLTEMFGSGNEPSTVDEFKALFPNDYYAYNSGTETTVSAVSGLPYSTYSVTFPDAAGTVYGGTLTNQGSEWKLRVTDAFWTKNTSAMDNSEDYPGWRDAGIKMIIGENPSSTVLTVIGNIGEQFSVNVIGSNDILFLSKGTYGKTQTEWKALAIDVQFVVPLATPIEYTLSYSQVVTLLSGENNLWHSANGETEVTYLARSTE